MEQVVFTGLLVFVRLATVISGLPIFGSLGMPRQAVILISFAVSFLVSPHLQAAPVPTSIAFLVLAVGVEVVYGYLVTLGVRVVFASIALAGEMMGMQMGLALATLFDPLQRESSSALGTLSTWLAGMVFLGAGLHLQVIEIVARSFEVSAPGALTLDALVFKAMARDAAMHFSLGLQLAGPLIALIFVFNVVMAMLTRLAPRMNVFFALGLTATSVGGMTLLWASLPWFLEVHYQAMRDVVKQFAGLLGV